MGLILEAIYDSTTSPIFKDCSYGYRRGRSIHTAFNHIRGVPSLDRILHGQIHGHFENSHYKRLEGLLRRYIEDQQFIDLY